MYQIITFQVYTINSESQHLFVYGVPKINLRSELKSLFSKHGRIVSIHVVENHKTELFTECYHVYYERIQSARAAKLHLDNKSFYGGVLHVCYAPEYESVEDTRAKLLQRNKDVLVRLQTNTSNNNTTENAHNNQQINRKRKHPALEINEERLQTVDQSNLWDGIPEEIDPRIPASKSRKISEPMKHFQMHIVLPEYGPQLPTQEDRNALLCDIENSVEQNSAVSDLNVKKQVIKSDTEKRIIFKK